MKEEIIEENTQEDICSLQERLGKRLTEIVLDECEPELSQLLEIATKQFR